MTFGRGFLENRAVICGNAANVMRVDVNAVIGKHGERRSVLHQCQIRRAQRERKIRRQRARDAELPGQVDHIFDADFVEQPHRRNIARIGEGPAQGDAPFEFLVVIVRRIDQAAAAERDGRVHHGVERRGALVESLGIYITLNELPVWRIACVARLNFDSSKS